MNACFHYFAVKYMAVRAGFSPEDSQIIAEYSQFLDDCTREIEVRVDESALPQDIMERELFTYTDNHCCIYIPKTAALRREEVATEEEWLEDILADSTWKYALLPFHYLPPVPLTDAAIEAADPRNDNLLTEDIRDPEGHAVFGGLLAGTVEAVHAAGKPSPGKPSPAEPLIRAGVLCHILADSFSHYLFSGLKHVTNEVKLMEIRDCQNQADLTKRYDPRVLSSRPAVGCLQAGSAMDDNGIMGGLIRQTRFGYTFNNREKTEDAAERILRFFFRCRNVPVDPANETLIKNTVAAIRELTDSSPVAFTPEGIKALARKWTDRTGLAYDYDRDRVRERLMKSDADGRLEELCRFNIVVDDVQRAVLADY
ncbi:hypothetical protein Sgly_1353 [Syntrophobotulus glycolicus DSM 8271]|uniref:Uncharacterized protein n=1 Tax=Syntrophobotulus glycolicus (strain DSM 8271 / FlGlyR) TaxID=645991 RepID=F0SVV2_SYNGF|nr:DUF6765 family protein [Syntrophobotulus glycolicus]ADY55658.1 hypothetical protein Sgly_1353 [Syntrophobotulus glycolicus DSM 8271]